MITYTTDVQTPRELTGFFVGWPTPPSPAQFQAVLRGSHQAILALDGQRVVGFVTAISDGVLTAYIPWLEVLPSHHGGGIGSELLRRMLAELGHLYSVDLTCDPHLRPFYTRHGLMALNAMGSRNPVALDGT